MNRKLLNSFLFLTFVAGIGLIVEAENIPAQQIAAQQPTGDPVQYFAPQQLGEEAQRFQAAQLPEQNPIRQVAGPNDLPAGAVRTANVPPAPAPSATPPGAPNGGQMVGTNDSILGVRLAKISKDMKTFPQKHDQIWREYDITPYTKGRQFPSNVQPEQTIIDWILRQTTPKLWHVEPFGILTADSEKLYVYHTKEVQLLVADIVDRFINPQMFNETYTIRVVTLARADWVSRGHQYLRPIPIATPGVQGWVLEEQGSQLLLQELSRRSDFQEIAPPQFLIPNGIAHNVAPKRQRTYLRDVQPNPAALNGYAEDRVTIEEGFSMSFVPLACADGRGVEAIIKLNVVQIEKMIAATIDVPTQANPRQRVQIESPQVACFELDEQIRWAKDKVLLLDLGTVPLPNMVPQQQEQSNFFTDITRNLAYSNSKRANVLLMIKRVGSGTVIMPQASLQPLQVNPALANPQPIQQPQPVGALPANPIPASPTVGSNPLYWQGLR